jgi:hypothetical protein
MNHSQRDLYQQQAKQEQKKVPLTLYGGKFYQRGETRSQEGEGGSRGGRGKERGRGWSIIKKTLFTPIGSQNPSKVKKKTGQIQHPTKEQIDNHKANEHSTPPPQTAGTDELEDGKRPDFLASPAAYSDYQPDYPDDLIRHQPISLSRYEDYHAYQSQARQHEHSPSRQYREYHNMPYEYQDLQHDYQDLPHDYQDLPHD